VEEIDMLEPLRPEKISGSIENGADEPLYKRPDVTLLDDRQWLYVQRRYHLSPRELQVAKHVCRGFANEEVARRLRIRSGTVKTHLRNIYRRIRVTNKIGMLLTFIEQVAALCEKPGACNGIAAFNTGKQINPCKGQGQTGIQS
jgi:DNA-binding NarL/FixJ family response regulator